VTTTSKHPYVRHVVQALVLAGAVIVLGTVGLCLDEVLGVVATLSMASLVGLAVCLLPCALTAVFFRRKWRERGGSSFRC
jgi:hypothetical protein